MIQHIGRAGVAERQPVPLPAVGIAGNAAVVVRVTADGILSTGREDVELSRHPQATRWSSCSSSSRR